MQEKLCRRCNQVKPLSEFPIQKNCKRTRCNGKPRPYCKACEYLRYKEYRARTGYGKRYYRKNRDKLLQKHRRWLAAKPENAKKSKDANKRWWENNPAKVQRLKDKTPEYCRRYYQRHRQKRMYDNKNRKIRRQGVPGSHTHGQWLARLAFYGWRCFYCGRNDVLMTKEHRIPLLRDGTNWASNLVPACPTCNKSKNNKTPQEFSLWLTTHMSANPEGTARLEIKP